MSQMLGLDNHAKLLFAGMRFCCVHSTSRENQGFVVDYVTIRLSSGSVVVTCAIART